MKKFLPLALLLITASFSQAQTWECGYVDLGKGIIEQSVILTETDESFSFQCKDTVNAEFVSQLEARLPEYDQILDIDFGPTTFIYTIDGSALVFRKCRASSAAVKPVAENTENKEPEKK